MERRLGQPQLVCTDRRHSRNGSVTDFRCIIPEFGRHGGSPAGWRALQGLDRAETLEEADWRELRKSYDGVVDNNSSMKANLKSDQDGQWLTAYAAFPKPDTGALRDALRSLPYVQKLCRPALRPIEADR